MAMTTQQINLYLPELRPRRDLVTAVRLLLVVGVLIMGMLLMTGWSAYQRSNLEQQLARIELAVTEQTVRTERVERELAARATDQALVREMNAREQRLAQSRDLYEFMSNTTLGNLGGFSEHMKDFSRASFQGLWLTEIRVRGDAGYVYLKGYAELPAMLPDYVGRLSAGRSAVSAQRFSRLQSSRATAGGNEVYEFILETGQ